MAIFRGDDSGFIDEVRERNDLVQVVSEYLPLRRNGNRYWGLCPFHTEKSPSFSVSADTQLFYCFGCHKGGTVYHFVMHMERLEFWEAVEFLAARAHMSMPERGARRAGPRVDKERLYDALKAAAKAYHALLWTDEGARARAYLEQRGVKDATIRRFGLGVTPDGWDYTIKTLEEQGFTEDELLGAGLAVRKENRRYDMFRARLMFPIIDTRGRVIAFGGRVMGEGSPKYLNSADTAVFNKRRNLYGINNIAGVKQDETVYLVEGYMDVVSLYQNGARACVATLGTALTPEQTRLIKRYTAKPVICYDGDDAGINASLRALPVFAEAGLEAGVKLVPGGQDPDDYIRLHGLEGFGALPVTDGFTFRLDAHLKRAPLTDDAARAQYAIEAMRVARDIADPVRREPYIERVMLETGFKRDVLMEQLRATPQKDAPYAQKAAGAYTTTNKRNTSDGTMYTAVAADTPDTGADVRKAEITLIHILLSGIELPEGMITEGVFSIPLNKEIAGRALAGGMRAVTAWLDEMEDGEHAGAVAGLLAERMESASVQDAIKTVGDCLKRLEMNALEGEIHRLSRAVKEEGNTHQLGELMELTRRYNLHKKR